ncbi:peptidase domain-containing ABC transporter [uncultured Anaerococcus sp.]|uniref:peptidase domain-containing ABC transporter n=1 Tax=uncultured Anaerococcus sp. TaxID=293428 RepID=UPI00261283A4|nr:peptidase domain-containing ABC transporter [uncultured Anaerococcus sp.]
MFIKKNRVKPIKQMEYSECGLVCLVMILDFYGANYTLGEFRDKYLAPKGGFSLYDLAKIADIEKLDYKAYHVEANQIEKSILPAIIHYKRGHFVVLEKIINNKYIVVDPVIGRHSIKYNDFKDEYSGFLLYLKPNTEFVKRKATKIKIISNYLKKNKIEIFRIVIISLVLQLMLLLPPLITKSLIDNSIHSFTYQGLLWIILFLAISIYIISSIRYILVLKFEIFLDKTIMTSLINKLLELKYIYYISRNNSDILMRTNSGTIIRDILSNNIISSLIDTFMSLIYFSLLYSYSKLLLLYLIVGLCAISGILLISNHFIKKTTSVNINDKVKSQQSVYEIIENIYDFKTMNLENKVFNKWNYLFNKELNSNKRVQRLQNITENIVNTFKITLPLLLFCIGIEMVKESQLSIGELVAFNSVAISLINPIISIISNISTINVLDVYIKRIEDILDSKSENKKTELDIRNSNRIEKIQFKDVSFSYSPFSNEVLKNINFNVKSGQTVAIVGKSGCGKSTLIKLIEGLFDPTSGKIEVLMDDGKIINPIDLRIISGNVTQNSKLISGTIYDNLTLGRDILNEEITEVCRKCNILDDIINLPMKFDTTISDDGTNFSGGQKQRLLLARALLSQPKILILDEATSNMDAETESIIYKNLEQFEGIKFIVAHRLSTIKNSDIIIFIIDGEVSSTGKHDDLIKNNPRYRELYEENIL